MLAAWQAWQQHDVVTAEAILEEVPPAFQQTWEYRHMWALCRRKAMPLKGHTGAVRSMAFSPDGRRVFGRDEAGKILAWDASTGHLLRDVPADIPPGRTSALHGNRRAYADGPLVRIERLLTPDEQERLRQQEEQLQ